MHLGIPSETRRFLNSIHKNALCNLANSVQYYSDGWACDYLLEVKEACAEFLTIFPDDLVSLISLHWKSFHLI